jgi:hypothetical protein
VVARAVVDLLNINPGKEDSSTDLYDPSVVYHLQNPKLFHWTRDLLPALRDAGLEFEILGQREWVQRLRQSDPDPKKNPTRKLVDFFAEKYDNDKMGRKGLVFVTELTENASETLRGGFDIIGTGLIKKMAQQWLKTW